MRAKRQAMLAVFTIVALFAGLMAVLMAAVSQGYEVKDLSSRLTLAQADLGKARADLAETKARLDEARTAIEGYYAIASWYGPGFHGRMAADGSIYNQEAYTIAHKTLPFGTIVVLEYKGRRVPAVVTDRGPYIEGRDFDLSLGLAKRLGLVAKGVDEIKVYQIDIKKEK